MSKLSKVLAKWKTNWQKRLRRWKNLPPDTVRSILIIRYSSMGDIVLTTPVVRALRQRYPEATIVYLTKLDYASMLLDNPYIDDILTLDNTHSATMESLRPYDFDILVDLHKNIRSKRVKRDLPQAQYYTFGKLNIQKWLLVNLKINALPDKSIVDRYFEGMRKLQLVNDGQGLDYFIPKNEQIKMSVDLPMSHQAGYVVGVIGGTYNTKKMPPEKWEELCREISYPIVLVGGEEDRAVGSHLETLTAGKKVYNACGKFSVHESADIIRRSMAVISHDTGMMHVAAAFSKPIVTLWGNTVRGFGMFPYLPVDAPRSQDAEVQVRCRPCSKLGSERCPRRHFRCMKKQNIAEVLEKLEKSLILTNQKKNDYV